MSEAQLFAAKTFPEIYERVLVQPLFRPFAEELVARLQPVQSDSLIDVACGTGITPESSASNSARRCGLSAWTSRRRCSLWLAMWSRQSTGAKEMPPRCPPVMASGFPC
jgi:hypothetical protein